MSKQFLATCISSANTAIANGQYAVAVELCQQAIQLSPRLPEGWYNLGLAYRGLGQMELALSALKKTDTLTRDNPDAQNSVGLQLLELGAFRDAERCLNRALFLAPGFVYAHSNLGMLHEMQGRLDEAEASFRKAIHLQPGLAPLYVNLSGLQNLRKRHELAELAARRAIELDPASSEAWSSLGLIQVEQKRYKDARNSFAKSFALAPQADFVLGDMMHSSMHICDWLDFEENLAKLEQRIAENRKAVNPFSVLALTSNLSALRKAAEIFTSTLNSDSSRLSALPKLARKDRIRIGYYSADFHEHATAYLMAELFELHDKRKFELVAFSFGPDTQDDMRQRVSAAFDRFVDVSQQTDREVALLSRKIGIDIAVDLKGYTQDSRPGIFACRVAPIQVNYLGFPGTMGADFMDYIIADQTLIPAESQPFYSEKVVYLPHSYQVNDAKRQISSRTFTREELGLPAAGFIFACFNNNYKITPQTFAGWMRILNQVTDSVLWLFEANADAVANLRKSAASQGIDPGRLIFATHMPLSDHLARIGIADLFLDTLPYNAHTTTSDALWAGLPVLTCTCDSFASRVAASLLNAIGLPELVTTTQQAFEDMAIALASDPEQLRSIKQKLSLNRNTEPLFDSKLFARNIETAYVAMYERYQAGMPPETFYVESGARC
jgi:predicted O-linked N-acetylglucosamine transferase (SPINDLY family)